MLNNTITQEKVADNVGTQIFKIGKQCEEAWWTWECVHQCLSVNKVKLLKAVGRVAGLNEVSCKKQNRTEKRVRTKEVGHKLKRGSFWCVTMLAS